MKWWWNDVFGSVLRSSGPPWGTSSFPSSSTAGWPNVLWRTWLWVRSFNLMVSLNDLLLIRRFDSHYMRSGDILLHSVAADAAAAAGDNNTSFPCSDCVAPWRVSYWGIICSLLYFIMLCISWCGAAAWCILRRKHICDEQLNWSCEWFFAIITDRNVL